MLRQHDMRHDRTGALALLIGYLLEAWDVDVGLLLLKVANEVTIRAEARGQVLAMIWVRRARRKSRVPSASPTEKSTIKPNTTCGAAMGLPLDDKSALRILSFYDCVCEPVAERLALRVVSANAFPKVVLVVKLI